MRVPLPPLNAQRRIVDILNRTERMKVLRRRAAERLRQFVPALFIRMFGDPVENRMGWEGRPVAGLMQEFRYGSYWKCSESTDSEHAVAVLRVPNVLRGRVDWTDLKFASLRGDERKKLLLEHGDILRVCTNGIPK